jgi:hypothetical protein
VLTTIGRAAKEHPQAVLQHVILDEVGFLGSACRGMGI